MAPTKIRKIVEKFKVGLRKAGFPPVRVYLFGSHARNEARRDSDIDICLVSREFKRHKERYRSEAVYIAFRTDPSIQLVLADPEEFKSNRLSPLFSRIRKEAIAA
ncbi:MAG: hypothetical protein COV46_07825 [Deltaproteobacteria bacterium CG11_big_fil_rev_8_21_14_0_20_49_13]|nr:MAG: hypothetical protein COV46_07825 [Deltaproteobacteria bacterium CG11_big_fil_rev_8_21_14_0_20_49_13]